VLARLMRAILSMMRSSRRMQGRNWSTEFFARIMRDLFAGANENELSWLRAQLDKIGDFYHPALSKVRINSEEIAGVACLLVSPKVGRDMDKVIVYFHGGGYVCGSPRSYRALIAKLAADTNSLVVAADYRLAPEFPFPVPQDDCLSVAQAVVNTHTQRKIILAGDSAGGALAISTALELAKNQENQRVKKNAVSALVLLSPWVEPTAIGGSMKTNADNDFLTASFLADGYAALIMDEDYMNPRTNFVDVDLSSLPKTLVQCGGGELFYDQIQSFCGRAERAGVDLTLQSYAAQFHVFQVLSGVLSDAKYAMAEVASFVERV